MPKNGSSTSESALYDQLHQHIADNHYNKDDTDALLDGLRSFHYSGDFDATQDTLPVPTGDNAGNYYVYSGRHI